MPNLSAQTSKLWQDREWHLRGEHRFAQLNDAIRRSVPKELRRLSQVGHAQRVETHQARTYEIGGDGKLDSFGSKSLSGCENGQSDPSALLME